MAKAGYLQLFHQLAVDTVIPEAVAREIQKAPPSDPARKILESGWGRRASPKEIPPTIVEWGLGAGESAVLTAAPVLPSVARYLQAKGLCSSRSSGEPAEEV
jgi:hypothetical protein